MLSRPCRQTDYNECSQSEGARLWHSIFGKEGVVAPRVCSAETSAGAPGYVRVARRVKRYARAIVESSRAKLARPEEVARDIELREESVPATGGWPAEVAFGVPANVCI